jgi:hypothetical protein
MTNMVGPMARLYHRGVPVLEPNIDQDRGPIAEREHKVVVVITEQKPFQNVVDLDRHSLRGNVVGLKCIVAN